MADPNAGNKPDANASQKAATAASVGPSPTVWNGQLNDPNGIMLFMLAEAAHEVNGDDVSPLLQSSGPGGYLPAAWYATPVGGGYGMVSWSSLAANTPGEGQWANTPVNQVPGPDQDAVARYNMLQKFAAVQNSWLYAAESWFDGSTSLSFLSNNPNLAPGNNNGETLSDYGNAIIANMHKLASAFGQNVPATPTVSTGAAGFGSASTGPGALIPTIEPVDNDSPVMSAYPLNLDYVQIRHSFLTDIPIGEGLTIRDLVSDCTVDMTVSELSSVVFTLQQGDIAINQLGIGIGAPGSLVEVDFCDSQGNLLWPLAISDVQMTANAAQQPAIQITCTSLVLQEWQAQFPSINANLAGQSPTQWLQQQCWATAGRTQYADGRWVFCGQRTHTGDPGLVAQPGDPATGTMQSTTYMIAQQCQQDQGFYMFDGFGTIWFGSPQWITTKTRKLYVAYVPAGGAPFDATTSPVISPVGPPQLSQTIQTVPNGFGLIQSLKVVRQGILELPQYIASQVYPGTTVILSGTGEQYDTPQPGQSPINGPQYPYIVTEVTGTVDGGMSVWNVTFEEAILASQPNIPTPGVTTPAPTFATPSTGGSAKDLLTGALLPADGTNTHLASAFVGYALAQVGKPYSEAPNARGTNPNPNGVGLAADQPSFDCSGLVYWAAYMAGVTFGTWTTPQFSAHTPITLAQGLSTPGALFFGAGSDPTAVSFQGGQYQIGHVSISLGNGSIVEAAFTGVGVVVEQVQLGGGGVVTVGGKDSNDVFTYAGLIPGMTYNMGIGGVGANGQAVATSPDKKS